MDHVKPLAKTVSGETFLVAATLADLQRRCGLDEASLLTYLLLAASLNKDGVWEYRGSDDDLADDLRAAGWGRGWAVKAVNTRLNALAGRGLLTRRRSRLLLPAWMRSSETPAAGTTPVPKADPGASGTTGEDPLDTTGAAAPGTATVPKADPVPPFRPYVVPKADPETHIMSDSSKQIIDHDDVSHLVVNRARALGVTGRALTSIPADPHRAAACLRVAEERSTQVGPYFNRIFLQVDDWPAGYHSGVRAHASAGDVVLVDTMTGSPLPSPTSTPARTAKPDDAPIRSRCGAAPADHDPIPAEDCPACRRGLHSTIPWPDPVAI